MSQEVGRSLEKFESFLEKLQNGINRGLDGELVAYKIKEVKVKREEVEEVLPTIETKEELEIVIPTFVIKLKQVEKNEIVQKKEKLNGIPKLVQEYINKYSNYIYYH
jgi:hypothetical protein